MLDMVIQIKQNPNKYYLYFIMYFFKVVDTFILKNKTKQNLKPTSTLRAKNLC